MPEDPKSLDIADAILTRRFDLDDGHVDIYVWAPVEEDNRFTRCDYHIVGLGSRKPRYSAGVDLIQALMGALHAINLDLYTSSAWKNGRLTWHGTRDLGLPSLPGDRPLGNDYGPAELLTLPGWQAVIRMPDTPMPYLAMSDESLAALIRNLKAVQDDLSTSSDKALLFLGRIIDGLLEQKRYYEAVCRENGLPPPPIGHDQ